MEKDKILRRWWEVQGQYDYWLVQEFRDIEGQKQGRAVYDSIPQTRKGEAQIVADALNSAYRAGKTDG